MLMGTGRAAGRGGADTVALIVSTLQPVEAAGSRWRGGNNGHRNAPQTGIVSAGSEAGCGGALGSIKPSGKLRGGSGSCASTACKFSAFSRQRSRVLSDTDG